VAQARFVETVTHTSLRVLVEQWREGIGREGFCPFLVVPAYAVPSTAIVLGDWLSCGLVSRFATCVLHEDFVRDLSQLDETSVVDDFRDLVDQGEIYGDAFRFLWEIKCELAEQKPVDSLVRNLLQWASGNMTNHDALSALGITTLPTTVVDRLDVLFFLIGLGQRHRLLPALVVTIPDVVQALEHEQSHNELLIFCTLTERWARLGVAVGGVLSTDVLLSRDLTDRLAPYVAPQHQSMTVH
jgi:hypothetical protein